MNLTFCAPCIFGLEGICANELKFLGLKNVRAENGRVLFEGDFYDLAKANICSRYAERIQILLAEFRAKTFDELFEGLTLLQTGKMQKLPIVLFGEEFWRKCVNFDYLVETGVISPGDLKLFHFVDTPEKAIEAIIGYYQKRIINDIAGNDQKQS